MRLWAGSRWTAAPALCGMNPLQHALCTQTPGPGGSRQQLFPIMPLVPNPGGLQPLAGRRHLADLATCLPGSPLEAWPWHAGKWPQPLRTDSLERMLWLGSHLPKLGFKMLQALGGHVRSVCARWDLPVSAGDSTSGPACTRVPHA